MADDQTYVYRLAQLTEWRAAQESGEIPLRDIDRVDEYFHLSTRAQLLETARLHFADANDLVALAIEAAALGDQLKFEWAQKRGEAFPHYYGALHVKQVRRVIALVKTKTGFEFGGDLR